MGRIEGFYLRPYACRVVASLWQYTGRVQAVYRPYTSRTVAVYNDLPISPKCVFNPRKRAWLIAELGQNLSKNILIFIVKSL